MMSKCPFNFDEIPVDVVISHSPCSDGYTAAWSAWKKYPDATFYDGNHEKNKGSFDYWMERVQGKHVLVCDFSFGREMTEKLAAASASYHVLDHHETAQKALGDLPYCYFDMGRSGALITWESLHPSKPVPLLVQYVSDRDIWQNKLPDTGAINTVIHRTERTFENWDQLAADIESDWGRDQIIDSGESMLAYQEGLVRDIAEKSSVWNIGGVDFLTANCPCIATEICDALRSRFDGPTASFEVMGDSIKFSLRSVPDGVSVSEVASKFAGGGGHRNASGFSLPLTKVDWANRRVVP